MINDLLSAQYMHILMSKRSPRKCNLGIVWLHGRTFSPPNIPGPTHLKKMRPSNWIISSKLGWKFGKVWNHHLVKDCLISKRFHCFTEHLIGSPQVQKFKLFFTRHGATSTIGVTIFSVLLERIWMVQWLMLTLCHVNQWLDILGSNMFVLKRFFMFFGWQIPYGSLFSAEDMNRISIRTSIRVGGTTNHKHNNHRMIKHTPSTPLASSSLTFIVDSVMDRIGQWLMKESMVE